jgi:Ni,Fe-hydrogenase III component G
MIPEEKIHLDLATRFPCLQGQIRVRRARRIFADVPAARFFEVFEYLVRDAGFTILCTITGLDQGPTLGALYHLAQESGIMLTLGTSVPKERPVLQTVTPCFPAAEAYEREMMDLFGMQVEGLPPGNRYPLPDDWPPNQYPLRKDWKLPEEPSVAETKEPSRA